LTAVNPKSNGSSVDIVFSLVYNMYK